jgi:hypothetical protein
MKIIVLSTTDGQNVGIVTETDLFTITLEGEIFQIEGRLHYGNGSGSCGIQIMLLKLRRLK